VRPRAHHLARRAIAHAFRPFQLGAKRFPKDLFCFCPTCSNFVDEDDSAPLAPGLVKTDHRSPLFQVSGDACAKAVRWAHAGTAQAGIEPGINFFFGKANRLFEAFLSSDAARTGGSAAHAAPANQICGSELRCVKSHCHSGGLFSSFGLTLIDCTHGVVASAVDNRVHGACASLVGALNKH
jgi:hypothetical protein